MRYPRLATRIYNVPLLISAAKGEIIEAAFRAYSEGDAASLPPFEKAPSAKQRLLAGPVSMSPTDSGFWVTNSGVAVIPIYGTLVQRADEFDAMSGFTGYNALAQQLNEALADRSVNGIMLDIDSPGGEAAGTADFAQQIRDATVADKKPVWAFANEMALSAAYWIASASTNLLMAGTGTIGSIGVICYHLDASQAEGKRGYTFTPIFAGARKADFSSHAPLTTAARAAAQEQVDHMYEAFVGAVAKYRDMPAERVRNTEAGLLHSTNGVYDGFANGTSTFADAVSMLANVARPKQLSFGARAESAISTGDTNMAEKDKEIAAAREDGLAAGKIQGLEQGKAEGIEIGKKQGFEEGKAAAAPDAQKTGAAAERTRVAAILGHAEADGRRKMAEHLAFKTNNSVDEAAALLAVAPKEAAAPSNPLANAMKDVPNPKVGADLGDMDETSGRAVLDKVVALHRNASKKA